MAARKKRAIHLNAGVIAIKMQFDMGHAASGFRQAF